MIKNNQTKFKPTKIVGFLVFFLAFILNIQTDVNGDWELVNKSMAQEESLEPSEPSSCVSQAVGDDAYMLCDYKKVFLSTNCTAKMNKTCLLRDTGPGWPKLPSLS